MSFIPKGNKAFTFVRSQGERISPKNFFTDGGSIPRLFRWSDDLDPFGSLPGYLLHDWEFDLHHCNQSNETFEDVASILMVSDFSSVCFSMFRPWTLSEVLQECGQFCTIEG